MPTVSQLPTLLQLVHQPLWVNAAIFAVAAALVWLAGTKLSQYADIISERTGLGPAFVGLLLLATATSLPEIATTVTGTLIGNVPLVVGNLLGGITMQTAILAVIDAVLVKGTTLTYLARKPVLLMQGLLLVLLLTIALTSIAIGGGPLVFGVGAGTGVLLSVYLVGLYLTQRSEQHPRWRPVGPAADSSEAGSSDGGGESFQGSKRGKAPESEVAEESDGGQAPQEALRERYRGTSTTNIALYFMAGASVILAAGWAIAQAGDALAEQTGLGGTLVGFVFVAVATSLPEVSTTFSAARLGAYAMAFSNIFGGNAFDASLLFLADVLYGGGPVLASAGSWSAVGASLGILVTGVYLWGMVARGSRRVVGIGLDSALVLALYVGGLMVLYVIH